MKLPASDVQLLMDQKARLSSTEPSGHVVDADSVARLAEHGIQFETVKLITSGSSVQVHSLPQGLPQEVDTFYICAMCGKVFWHGSHFDRIHDQFDDVLSVCGVSTENVDVGRAAPCADKTEEEGKEDNSSLMSHSSDQPLVTSSGGDSSAAALEIGKTFKELKACVYNSDDDEDDSNSDFDDFVF